MLSLSLENNGILARARHMPSGAILLLQFPQVDIGAIVTGGHFASRRPRISPIPNSSCSQSRARSPGRGRHGLSCPERPRLQGLRSVQLTVPWSVLAARLRELRPVQLLIEVEWRAELRILNSANRSTLGRHIVAHW